MDYKMQEQLAKRYRELSAHFGHWEKTKDLIDQNIDIVLNYRQSGHPAGRAPRSHVLLATLLERRHALGHPPSREALRRPVRPRGGHTVPLIYCTLAVLNEAMRIKYRQTGDKRYFVPKPEERMLYWEDLLGLRRNKGPERPRRNGGQDAVPQIQHGPVRPWSPGCGGRSTRAEAGRRRRRKGVRLRRRGRPNARRHSRDDELGLGPGAGQPLLRRRLERLRDRRPRHQRRRSMARPTDWFGSHGWRVFSGPTSAANGAPVTQAMLS